MVLLQTCILVIIAYVGALSSTNVDINTTMMETTAESVSSTGFFTSNYITSFPYNIIGSMGCNMITVGTIGESSTYFYKYIITSTQIAMFFTTCDYDYDYPSNFILQHYYYNISTDSWSMNAFSNSASETTNDCPKTQINNVDIGEYFIGIATNISYGKYSISIQCTNQNGVITDNNISIPSLITEPKLSVLPGYDKLIDCDQQIIIENNKTLKFIVDVYVESISFILCQNRIIDTEYYHNLLMYSRRKHVINKTSTIYTTSNMQYVNAECNNVSATNIWRGIYYLSIITNGTKVPWNGNFSVLLRCNGYIRAPTMAPTDTTIAPSSAPTLKYPTERPSNSPTWMPTINGAFPYIHYVQSYIGCGKNIELQDTMYSDGYAQFVVLDNVTNVDITFIVCKPTSPFSTTTFHWDDMVYLWYGDDDNSTEWNVTKLSGPIKTIKDLDCVPFKASNIDTLYPQTYFVGLIRYNENDYGKYTIYMQCADNYTMHFQPVEYIDYNEYIQPGFDESELVGSISCGVTLSYYVSKTEWFGTINKEQFYSFIVKKYTEWVEISTCDNTNKLHTVSLYYTDGGTGWNTIYQIISDSLPSCPSLKRSYLIPGTYYIGIDISNLLYNDYTLRMECSRNDSIVTASDYISHIETTTHKATVSTTPRPSVSVETVDNANYGTQDNSTEVIGSVIAVLIVIGLGIGAYFGYRKYKNRYKNKNKNKNKNDDIAIEAGKVEMVAVATPSNHNDDDIESSEEIDESKSDIDDDNDNDNDNLKMKGPSEGELIAAEGGEGVAFNMNEGGGGADEAEAGGEDVAPAAFANFDFEAVPNGVYNPIPIKKYDEVDVVQNDNDDDDEDDTEEDELPDEQREFQIGSYCYVDCDTVYGVIVDELQYDYYLIIDFFEKRKRKSHKKALSLIQDMSTLNKAKKRHQRYKRSKRKKSSTKKYTD